MKIQTFSPNKTGKDFVCSDIHGHFSLLEAQLKSISFNQDKDRLFCLGDLIDRGDESSLVIEYLSKPWFYSILGNHELMLIDAFESESGHIRTQWNFWGGDWAEDFDDDKLERYYEALVDLPMAIELILSDGKTVGLVHAELPNVCDWESVKSALANKSRRDNITNSPLIRGMLWNKEQVGSPEAAHSLIPPVDNIDHVFHGHTILNAITTISNRTFMDLGSYESGLIGLISPSDFLKVTDQCS